MRFLGSTDVGFTLGGHHSDEFGAFLTAYQVPPTPTTRDNELQLDGRTGVYDAGTELSRLDVSMQVGLWVASGSRASINDAVRRLTALLDPRLGYQALSFDEDPDYYLLAKLTSTSGTTQINAFPKGRNGEMAAQVDVAMKAADPHWYSTAHPRVTVPSGVINNPGLAPTPVVITLTGTANTGAGTHKGVIIGGVEVGYQGALNTGQQVVIDTDLWSLTKGGVNDIGNWYGEMPLLPGGQSTVQVVGSVTATIAYTPRWVA